MKKIEKLAVVIIAAAIIIFLALFSMYESDLIGGNQTVSDNWGNMITILLNQ
jgi:hypothetical protein